MATTSTAIAEPVTIASTNRFRLEAKKDGVIWALTSATVTLLLRKPDGTGLVKTATVTDGPGGVAEYVSLTTDLDVIGGWRRSWRVVDGAVDVRSLPIPFSVQAAP